jgi:putative ABC transport system permease protein
MRRPEPHRPVASGRASIRPALRIARRDLLRSKGRNALVMIMVGVPVFLVVVLSTMVATDAVSAVESIPARLGQTQAELTSFGGQPLTQDANGDIIQLAGEKGGAFLAPGSGEESFTAAELQKLSGRSIIEITTTSSSVRTKLGRFGVDVVRMDATDPRLSGIAQLRSGRFPKADVEVAVSGSVAEKGYRPGSTIQVGQDDTSLRVVGVLTPASDQFSQPSVIGRPGLVIAGIERSGDPNLTHKFLVAGQEPVTWAQVTALNAKGVVVFSRSVVRDPASAGAPVRRPPGSTSERVTMLIAGLVVALEVVLLAGPALAVGARRQRRHLALIVATGGSPRDVRRVVLLQGLVSGALATGLGVVLGLVGAAGLVWALRHRTNLVLGPYDISWQAVALTALLAAAASLLAAYFPARSSAKMDVVSALAGRRDLVRGRRGLPVLGLVLMVAGIAVTILLGTRKGREIAVVPGILALVLGAIALTPGLIGVTARLGSRLPLPLRLATRDGARNRSRTAPAVAAVMAAVAGITTAAVATASVGEAERRDYRPRSPAGVTTISLNGDQRDALAWEAVDRATADQLPGQKLLPVGRVGTAFDGPSGPGPSLADSLYVARPGCPAKPRPALTGHTVSTEGDSRCSNWAVADASGLGSASGLVATPATLRDLGWRLSAEELKILAGGGVLLPSASLIDPGGTVDLVTYRMEKPTAETTVTHKLVAGSFTAISGDLPEAIMTPDTARNIELAWYRSSGVLSGSSNLLPKDAQGKLTEKISGIVDDAEVYTERGYVNDLSLITLVLLIAGALAVLIGTLTATGLALTDSRPDLSTMAAMGAPPRFRRIMAASQAWVVAALGALTGVAVGLVPGIALSWPLTTSTFSPLTGEEVIKDPIIAVPWLTLLVIGLVVPLLGAAVTGISVRSRVPLTRRLGQ